VGVNGRQGEQTAETPASWGVDRPVCPSPVAPDRELRETDLLILKDSSIHGRGGFAKVNIVRGCKVIEYVGDRITKKESLQRCEANNPYIFNLSPEQDLDGNVPWNPARFLNHSCAPNCDAEVDEGHIWILARRHILAGEELTFNYGYDLEDYKNYPCHCGASNCVGFIVAEEFFEHVTKARNCGGPGSAAALDGHASTQKG
jgi:uncharacterized protein